MTSKFKIFFLLLALMGSLSYLSAQAELIVGESIHEVSPGSNEANKVIIDGPRAKSQTARSVMEGPILYNQSEMINYPGQGFGGADVSGTTGALFGVSVDIAANFLVADEFVVPPGQVWMIDSIVVFNYQTNSTSTSTINDVRMQISQGMSPGSGNIVFGDLVTNNLANSYFTGIYRTLPGSLTNTQRPIMRTSVNTGGLSLSPGTYFIEYQAGGSLPSGPFCILRTLGTTHIATGNAYQNNGTWNNLLEFDTNGNNPLPKGLTFIVYGQNCLNTPTATFSALASSCNGLVENNNGSITLETHSNATHYGISSPNAVSYDGPASTGTATMVPPAGSQLLGGLSHSGVSYIIRLFNEIEGCSIDYSIDVPAGPDCSNNLFFDLALTKTVSNLAEPLIVGSVITYEISVINQGTIDATNIDINDFVPTGLSLTDPNWTAIGNVASLNSPIAVLNASTQTSVTISFTINEMAFGDIVNMAEISQAFGGNDEDSTPGNGSAAPGEDDFDAVGIPYCAKPVLTISDGRVCRGSILDLNTLVLTHTGDELQFYLTMEDALNGTNQLSSAEVIIQNSTSFFVKSLYEPAQTGCESIEKIRVYLSSPNCGVITITKP